MGLVAAALWLGAPGAAAADNLSSWGGADVSAGGFVWRPRGDRDPAWRDGLELSWGPTTAAAQSGWRFTGLIQVDLRAFATSSWALGLSTHAFEVAWRIGSLEPYLRVGGALVTVDDFGGAISAEMLSPRVGAGVAVRVARRVAIGVGAYSEYFWRWFGPSAFVHGIVVDVRFEKPMRRVQ